MTEQTLNIVEAGIVLIVAKAFLEPAAIAAGQWLYRKLDNALYDKLPNLFRGKDYD